MTDIEPKRFPLWVRALEDAIDCIKPYKETTPLGVMTATDLDVVWKAVSAAQVYISRGRIPLAVLALDDASECLAPYREQTP